MAIQIRRCVLSLVAFALITSVGCGPAHRTQTPPSPPPFTPIPTQRSELSWRERVRRAVDTVGDRCFPGRHFELDPGSAPSSPTSQRPDATQAVSLGRNADSPKHAVTSADGLEYLADIELAQFRKGESELILIGPPAEPGAGISVEDWLTVLRAISGPEAPGVTIDPGSNANLMQVRYFGGIERTNLGETFFEADRTLKLLSTGFDNNTCEIWTGRPSAIPTEMDLMSSEVWANTASGSEGWHRYWFEPVAAPLEAEETAKSFTVRIPLERLVVNDESIPPGRPSRGSAHEFAGAVTKNFLDATSKIPSFRGLQSAAALVAIAKWIQDNRIPIDESWVGSSISPVATVQTTPSITVLRAAVRDQIYLRYGIHGGVDFQKDNAYRPSSLATDPIEVAATRSEPRTDSRWDFAVGERKYRAIKLKVEHPTVLSPRRTRWVRFAGEFPQPGMFRLVFPDSTLEVVNGGLSSLSVRLRGPVAKDMVVSRASETITVLPGSYEISVSTGACLPRTDTFTVDESQSYRLQFECRVPPPPPRPPEGFYIIQNNTGGSIQVVISGPSAGTHQIPPGSSTLPLLLGSYTVRVVASCGERSQTFTVSTGSRFTGTYTCQIIR